MEPTSVKQLIGRLREYREDISSHLIPLSEFIEEIADYAHESKNYQEAMMLIEQYNRLLGCRILPWHFVLCDELAIPIPYQDLENELSGLAKAAEKLAMFKGWKALEPIPLAKGGMAAYHIENAEKKIRFDYLGGEIVAAYALQSWGTVRVKTLGDLANFFQEPLRLK